MDNMTVRWGATLPLILTNDEPGGSTADLTISKNDVQVSLKTVNFNADGITADLSLSADETMFAPGLYDYMVTVRYYDGTVEKYPDMDDCSDCALPTLEICDTNDNLEVS